MVCAYRQTYATTISCAASSTPVSGGTNNERIRSTLGYMSPVGFREAGLSL